MKKKGRTPNPGCRRPHTKQSRRSPNLGNRGPEVPAWIPGDYEIKSPKLRDAVRRQTEKTEAEIRKLSALLRRALKLSEDQSGSRAYPQALYDIMLVGGAHPAYLAACAVKEHIVGTQDEDEDT